MDDGWPRTLTACAGCRERDARIAELERQLADSQRRTTELERKLAEVTRNSQRQTVKPSRSGSAGQSNPGRHGLPDNPWTIQGQFGPRLCSSATIRRLAESVRHSRTYSADFRRE
jgi:hypothetical protein